MKKEKQQTYNVIFIWDKKPNLNPKPNSKPNTKHFFTLTMVDFNLTINNHTHGLVAKLSCNNEQDINALDIL